MDLTIEIHTIDNKYGTFSEAHFSEDAQRESVYAYVVENWNKLYEPEPMPENKQAAIKYYFENACEEWISYDSQIVNTENLGDLFLYHMDMREELDARGFKTDDASIAKAKEVWKAHLENESQTIFSDVISNFIEEETEQC